MGSLASVSDLELIALLKQGNADAFTTIFDRYQPIIYVYAVKVIKDRDEAADVVQEVFLYLWNKRDSIELDGPLLSYLYTAVRYKFYNLLDKKKVRLDYADALARFTTEGAPLTENLVLEREMLRIIEEQVALLPAKLRQVYELANKANMTAPQIATILNVSEKTVQNQLSLAVRQLRLKIGALQLSGLAVGAEVLMEFLEKNQNI